CIATEACRKAGNGKDFIEQVRAETGLTFKIIGPAEEARLAVIGCHDLFDPDAERVMVLDIGGGSTEVAFVESVSNGEGGLGRWIEKPPIAAWRSFKIGVVTLCEPFSHLPENEAYLAMRDHALEVFAAWKSASALGEAMGAGQTHIIGTSGTVTCLAGAHLGLKRYSRDAVDGAWMTRQDGRDIVKAMRDAGPDGRAAFPTIGPERAGLMLAGCAILDAAWETWPSQRLRVADRGLREGLLLSMMHGPKRKRRRRRSNGVAQEACDGR
ncbi:MAG: Ppx/GppA family phosphatase, partial [Pseudomonadota bacterium]